MARCMDDAAKWGRGARRLRLFPRASKTVGIAPGCDEGLMEAVQQQHGKQASVNRRDARRSCGSTVGPRRLHLSRPAGCAGANGTQHARTCAASLQAKVVPVGASGS
jgi:hypothetical protein